MKTISVVYEWKEGSRIRVIDAKTAAERFEEIRRRVGKLTPKAVVDDARPVDSPLHPAFEWDDHVAAEKYREEQARHLIRSLVIRTVEEGPTEPVRAYVSVPDVHTVQDGTERNSDVYVPTQIALSDEFLRAKVLERALNELRQFRRKYSHLKELAEVFAAADRILGPDDKGSEFPRPAA